MLSGEIWVSSYYVEFLGPVVFLFSKSITVIHTQILHKVPYGVYTILSTICAVKKMNIHTKIRIINNLTLSHIRFCNLLTCKKPCSFLIL